MLKRFIISVFAVLMAIISFGCSEAEIPETSENVSEETESESVVMPEFDEPDKEPQGFLWKVTDENGACIWLFGSTEVGCDEFYPLDESVVSAFESSDVLAVDYDSVALLNNHDLQLELFLNYQIHSDGSSLSDRVGNETYNEAVRILVENELYNSYSENMKAVFVSELIDNVISNEVGLSSEFSTKTYLLDSAYSSKKSIIEIENAKTVWQIKSSFSDELQSFMLTKIISGYKDGTLVDERRQIKTAFQNGDLGLLERLTLVPVDKRVGLYGEFYQKMIKARNDKMTDFCVSQLDSDKTAFVCVGLNHIIGDEGLVAKLQSLGYKVERI